MTKLTIITKDKTTELSINPLLLTVAILVLGILGVLALILGNIKSNSWIPQHPNLVDPTQHSYTALIHPSPDPYPTLPPEFTPQGYDFTDIHYTLVKPNSPQESFQYPNIWEQRYERVESQTYFSPKQNPLIPFQRYNWDFSWCGSDLDNMREMIDQMTVSFLLNGVPIDSMVYSYVHDNCTTWTTIFSIEEIRTNQYNLSLKIQYTIHESFSNGTMTFPKGTYTKKLVGL